ncbi:MAG: nickel-dependent lactate racemase [Methylacidiphilales bacterium]|nr:nickel-dependent lactate racemase [Candidatus Methylacidiphilales bacterium]
MGASPDTFLVRLAYGRGHLPVALPVGRTDVMEPLFQPGLRDERAGMEQALASPIGTRPLVEWLKPGSRICIVFNDITRATPNERIIPWILETLACAGVKDGQITLLNATGTHRGNTPAELETMLTKAVVDRYRVINHDCHDDASLATVGRMRSGKPARLNRHLVEADVRIITGFIEPHFFAGFSGGIKGIMPGVGGLDSIVENHGAKNIGDARATFGITEGNPLWEELRDIALSVGDSFLINVALNESRAITGIFAGHIIEAHRAGIAFVRASAMRKVDKPYPIVITTNSGYPLDLNLYQGVKGMQAAAQIIEPGGLIILAAECCEGLPAKSPHEKLLFSASTGEELLGRICSEGFSWPEQWAAHIQTLIQKKAEVLLHSSMPDEIVRRAHLVPCHDIAQAVKERLAKLGPDARVAALPQGPLTLPYLA